MKILVQLQNTKTKGRKRMRRELRCQKRAWAGLHRLTKHRLVAVHAQFHSYPKRGQPYICFHFSVGYAVLQHLSCQRAAGLSGNVLFPLQIILFASLSPGPTSALPGTTAEAG